MTKFDLVHIDPFLDNTKIVPPFVPHIFTPTSDHDSCRVLIDNSIDTGNLAPTTSVLPSPPISFESPIETTLILFVTLRVLVSPLNCQISLILVTLVLLFLY